jgi:hypothetical protein
MRRDDLSRDDALNPTVMFTKILVVHGYLWIF